MIAIQQIVTVVETEMLMMKGNSDDEYVFRVEVLGPYRAEGRFHARVWRRECFRIQSTFPQDDDGIPKDEPSDEMIL